MSLEHMRIAAWIWASIAGLGCGTAVVLWWRLREARRYTSALEELFDELMLKLQGEREHRELEKAGEGLHDSYFEAAEPDVLELEELEAGLGPAHRIPAGWRPEYTEAMRRLRAREPMRGSFSASELEREVRILRRERSS